MFASAMDVIFAAEDAKFLPGQVQYLHAPWDLGPRKAKEVMFEHRFMTAREACRHGFVNRVYHPDRLTYSVRRVGPKASGKWKGISWDEALDLVARKLSDIKTEFGPDSIGVLTSARITNEENYVAQKFARAVLKTNNVDHCARL